MKLTKELLESMYDSMSLQDMATKLEISKSTLYYHMKKLGVACRNKSDAQVKHIKEAGHQRSGTHHSDDTRDRISSGTKQFWDSDRGKEQKKSLRDLRKSEWSERSGHERNQVLARLQDARRPEPGELSNFGRKLAEFLGERERVSTGIKLTNNHVSDIILDDRKVVIELIFPFDTYGDKQKNRLQERYERIEQALNSAGYRVMIVEDKSNSISKARCQRVYKELQAFFNQDLKAKRIVS